MKARDRGGIPGITGEGASVEAASAVDKISDNYFDDLLKRVSGG